MIDNLNLITKKLSEERDVNYEKYSEDIRAFAQMRKMNLDLIDDKVPEELKVKTSALRVALEEAVKQNPLIKDFNKVPTSLIRQLVSGAYEATIQGVYATNMVIASNHRIRIIDRGRTDGILEFRDEQGNFLGYGLIEYKRRATGKNQWGQNVLLHGLLQVIAYYFRVLTPFERENFKVFCIACEDYFLFVNKSDIQDLLDTLEPKIAERSDLSPCKLYTDWSLVYDIREVVSTRSGAFHKINIDDKSMFNGIIEELFLNVKYVA